MIALLFGIAYAWEPLPQGSWAWQDEPIEDGFRVSASFDGATGGGPGWDAAIRDAAVKPEDNVTLQFDAARVHVFGADGHNLRRDAPPVESEAALLPTAS